MIRPALNPTAPIATLRNLSSKSWGLDQLPEGLPLQVGARHGRPGDLVLLYRGANYDPHAELDLVLSRHPAAVIVETQAAAQQCQQHRVPWILVACGRSAWSTLCAAYHGDPQHQLQLVGITGTNGKTSTAWILHHLLSQHFGPSASLYIGTLGSYDGHGNLIPGGHTTPDPPELFALLRQHLAAGGRYVCLEVSSHAIAQRRVAALRFAVAIWTSFSRDHLDFHHTLENYWETKAGWMRTAAGRSLWYSGLQLNQAPLTADQLPAEAWTFGPGPAPTSRPHVQLSWPEPDEIHCHLPTGEQLSCIHPYESSFHRLNLAAALTAWHSLTAERDTSPFSSLPQVPGRFDVVCRCPWVVVDYAHTPDALAVALRALRQLAPGGRLAVVFGCGGNRDPGKRPLMGRVAAEHADRIWITSDNPRREDPAAIAQAIAAGVHPQRCETILDRERAIAEAISWLTPQDALLIAGKGHETTQTFGERTLPFDDRSVADAQLRAKETE